MAGIRDTAFAAAALLALSCAADAAPVAAAGGDADAPAPGTSRSAIIKGEDSPASEDAVVLIKHYDAVQIGGGAEGCTGIMLTPRLVLTARHCVAATDPQLACDSKGNAIFGGAVKGSYPASKLFAFSGTAHPDFLSSLDRAARGAELIDDGAQNLCNHDLALLLLEKPLPGAKIAPVRLEGGPRADEKVTVVGWGVTENGPDPATRKRRTGVTVLSVGPAEALGPSEFKVGESACAGDSGGPAFSASGAVVGVLSRGGNGTGAKPGDPAGCIDGENVFTSAAGFKDLILSAYAKAGQDPWSEGQPDPTTLPRPAAPPPAEEEGGGCTIARAASASAAASATALTLAVVACLRRRRARSSAR